MEKALVKALTKILKNQSEIKAGLDEVVEALNLMIELMEDLLTGNRTKRKRK